MTYDSIVIAYILYVFLIYFITLFLAIDCIFLSGKCKHISDLLILCNCIANITFYVFKPRCPIEYVDKIPGLITINCLVNLLLIVVHFIFVRDSANYDERSVKNK